METIDIGTSHFGAYSESKFQLLRVCQIKKESANFNGWSRCSNFNVWILKSNKQKAIVRSVDNKNRLVKPTISPRADTTGRTFAINLSLSSVQSMLGSIEMTNKNKNTIATQKAIIFFAFIDLFII